MHFCYTILISRQLLFIIGYIVLQVRKTFQLLLKRYLGCLFIFILIYKLAIRIRPTRYMTDTRLVNFSITIKIYYIIIPESRKIYIIFLTYLMDYAN